MNKVYNVLFGVLVLFGSIMTNAQQEALQLLSQEQNTRFEAIVSLYESKSLESIKYDFNGDFDALNNDIALMEKHAALMISDKKNAEGVIYAKVIPAAFKASAVGSGIVSLASGFGTAVSGYMSCRAISSLIEAFKQNTALTQDKEQAFLFFVPLSLLCTGATIATGVAAKILWNVSNKNQLFIEKTQKAYEQDMRIITQLKKIRYELTHN